MKKVILLLVSILLISSGFAFAEVPCKINYQGRLIKDNVPVDGTRTMKFSIYDSAVGPTLLWTSGNVSVEVHNGLFRYVIGSDGTDLSGMDWTAGQALYLEVVIDGETLTPREELSAYPYAINSHLLEGKTTDYFLNASGDTQTKQGNLNIMGNVGIGTTSPGVKLDVAGKVNAGGMVLGDNSGKRIQTSSNMGFRAATSGTDHLIITTSGNVGIGTTSPGEKLTVAGTIESTSGGVKFPDGSLQTTANPKGWVYCNSAGTIQASYNVSSVTKNGKGDYTVNWNTGFSSANYAVAVTPVGTSGRYSAGVHTLTAGSARIRTFETYNGWNEDHDFHVVAFGAQ